MARALYLEINGCKTFVDSMGPETDKVILALHSPGGSVDSRYLRSVFQRFARDYRVVLFDLRGCGRSQDVGVPSFSQLTSDIEAVRNALGLGRVVVAGSSGGGYLSLEYAARYPGSVRGLILWSTAPVHTSMAILRKNVAAFGIPIDWDRFERYWSGRCSDNDDLKKAMEELSPLYVLSAASELDSSKEDGGPRYWRYKTHNAVMQEQSGGWSVESRLPGINVPALVLVGDKDWIIPLENSLKLRDGLPQNETEVFEGCGHWLNREDTPKFEEKVSAFLKRVYGPS